ncbi:MAG: hypothetical protein U0Q22_16080 [Acidimicrobiales bacterium]
MTGERSRAGRWRASALVREAVRNVGARRGPLAPLALVAVFAGSVLGAFAVERRSDLDDALARQRARGAQLIVLATPSAVERRHARVTRRSCEALGASERRAALFATPSTDRFAAFGGRTQVLAVSPTWLRQLDRSALVGRSVSKAVGVRRIVGERSGRMRAAPLSAQPDGVDLNTSLVVPLDRAVAWGPMCVVEVRSMRRPSEAASRLLAAIDTDGSSIAASTTTAPGDPVADYLRRVERFFPLVVGAVLAALVSITAVRRGPELAAYRLSGTPTTALLVLLQLETLLLAGCMWAAAAAAIAVGRPSTADVAPLACAVATAPLCTLALVPLGVARLARRDGVTLAKG